MTAGRTASPGHDHGTDPEGRDQPGWIDEALAEHERLELDTAGRRRLPLADREQQVLDRIDRARRRKPRVREERITMSHGSGGKATHTLIEAIFLDAFRNPLLEPLEDAAQLRVGGLAHRRDDSGQVRDGEAFLEDEAGRQVQRGGAGHGQVVDRAVDG